MKTSYKMYQYFKVHSTLCQYVIIKHGTLHNARSLALTTQQITLPITHAQRFGIICVYTGGCISTAVLYCNYRPACENVCQIITPYMLDTWPGCIYRTRDPVARVTWRITWQVTCRASQPISVRSNLAWRKPSTDWILLIWLLARSLLADQCPQK